MTSTLDAARQVRQEHADELRRYQHLDETRERLDEALEERVDVLQSFGSGLGAMAADGATADEILARITDLRLGYLEQLAELRLVKVARDGVALESERSFARVRGLAAQRRSVERHLTDEQRQQLEQTQAEDGPPSADTPAGDTQETGDDH